MRGERPARTLSARHVAQLPRLLDSPLPHAPGAGLWREAVSWNNPWSPELGMRVCFLPGTLEVTRARILALRTRYACGYCGLAPATGYVRAYRARVCEPCYQDHHGGGDA